MKKKLLLLGAVLVSGLSGWSQNDVTSTYLTNPDFEGEYTTEPSAKGATNTIAIPNGWTMSHTNNNTSNIKYDLSVVDPSESNYSSNFSKMAREGSDNGNRTYYIRLRWNQSTLGLSQSVTLPKGTYTLSADMNACDAKSSDKQKMEIFAGDHKVAADKTTSKGTTWTNYSVTFTITKETTLNIGLLMTQGNGTEFCAGVDNFKLTYKELELSDLKAALKSAIDAAPAVPTEHVSENGAFDYNKTQCDKITSTLATAQGVYEKASATQAEVEAQITAVEALTAPSLNAPSATQAYKIILKSDGYTYDNCAMTACVNARADMGNYNVQYSAQNANYAQAMYFTQVEGGYNISWTDADGNTRYLCSGDKYEGGNDGQIRTTTTAEDAVLITITRNGDYFNLYDCAAKIRIGSQDAGVFPVEKNNDFTFEETTATNKITVSMAAGYATVCLPYNATISGINAYTITGVEGTSIQLAEATDGLTANTAYILEGTSDVDFSGVNVAYAEPNPDAVGGCTLKGVYKEQNATAGTYVLQKQGEDIPYFYLVANTYEEGQTPVVKANRAYLIATAAEGGVKALHFAENETAIQTVNALTSGKAPIYDINGRQLSHLQKGVNIVGGVKILVK